MQATKEHNIPLQPPSPEDQSTEQSSIAIKDRRQFKRPSRYKVLLHNDDYTTMDFVVLVLKKYFAKSQEEAMQVMLQIHQQGVGVGGVYTFEVAETKAQKVTLFAKQHNHPLRCTVEKKEEL